MDRDNAPDMKEETSVDEAQRNVRPAAVFLPPTEMRAHVAELHRQRGIRLIREREGSDITED